ncbi:MAG: DUF6580 family putative transport protein [Chitinophagaceae bacterium]
MKLNKKLLLCIGLIIVVSALYRVSPLREYGFAPQWAIAIFSGFIFSKDKKWAFALPLFSMLLSDVIYEILFSLKLTNIQGFYGKGQIINYALFALVTCIGFFIKQLNVAKIAAASIAAPTVFFLLSNFDVWISSTGYLRAKTFAGLMQCYEDGLPFYKTSLIGTFIFSTILFVAYSFIANRINKVSTVS